MLSDIQDRGWVMVEPPEETDEPSVIARYDGEPIKAGFMIDERSPDSETFEATFRSGCYDVDVKIDFEIGRGQVKVTRAEGYGD